MTVSRKSPWPNAFWECARPKELRQQTLDLIFPGREVSWEDLRLRRWPGGDRVGVTLSVPVWVPSRAQKLQTYCAFEKKWQTVAQTTPRKSGYVWFAPQAGGYQ